AARGPTSWPARSVPSPLAGSARLKPAVNPTDSNYSTKGAISDIHSAVHSQFGVRSRYVSVARMPHESLKRLLFAPRLETVLKPPSRALMVIGKPKCGSISPPSLAVLQAETGFC